MVWDRIKGKFVPATRYTGNESFLVYLDLESALAAIWNLESAQDYHEGYDIVQEVYTVSLIQGKEYREDIFRTGSSCAVYLDSFDIVIDEVRGVNRGVKRVGCKHEIPLSVENLIEMEGATPLLPEEYTGALLGTVDSWCSSCGARQSQPAYHRGTILATLSRDMSPSMALEYFEFNISGAYLGTGTPCYLLEE